MVYKYLLGMLILILIVYNVAVNKQMSLYQNNKKNKTNEV